MPIAAPQDPACCHDLALRILGDLTDLPRETAAALLERSDRNVKLALVMHWTGLDQTQSAALLTQHQDNLRQAIAASVTL